MSVRTYFGRRAETYSEGNWQDRGLFPAEERAIAGVDCDRRFALDLGSGPGKAISALSANFGRVAAVDISREMLALATHGDSRIVGDCNALPVRASSVDLCYMRMSLHYLNLDKIFAELARVLTPRGRVIVTSILPYGDFDEIWFNQRHRLKGKHSAWTPSLPSLLRKCSGEMRMEGCEYWTQENSLRRSLRSNTAGDFSALKAHAVNASPDILSVYRISELPDGDIRSTVLWGVIVLCRR